MTVRWTKRTPYVAMLALLGLALVACPSDEAADAEATPAASTKPTPPETRADLAEVAINTSLVASPTELQEAMIHAGVDTKFGSLIKRRNFALEGDDKERIAMRTGIVLADLVLTVNEWDPETGAGKDTLVGDLENLRKGLASIGAGNDLDATLGEVIDHVKADAVSPQELWLQVEEMREAAYGELAQEAGVQVVPLVQAGTWLEGTCLLAAAVLAAEERGNAPNLLRQPDVVSYFHTQLKVGEGEVSDINTLARGTLEQIHDITMKDSLTIEDVQTVHKLTDELLGKL